MREEYLVVCVIIVINVSEVGIGETFGSLIAFLHKTFSKFKQVKTDQK